MPYVLSPCISVGLPGLWGEGAAYERSQIYDIHSQDPKAPPVNYCAHIIKPHSLPHVDFPSHILPDGASAEIFFENPRVQCFFGPAVVVRLTGKKWRESATIASHFVWEVSLEDLQQAVERVCGSGVVPEKLFITAEDAPCGAEGFHDSKFVLILSVEAALWLTSNASFNAYGTSWKSSDFQPGSRERPIHKILLKQAVLFEQLKLQHVPEGTYFLSAFPLALAGASESPCTPVLYEQRELFRS